MSIASKIEKIKAQLPPHVTLVAISKTKPEEDIISAYKVGQRDFGENKVQDLREKYEHLPKDIRWHFIGHLQTNKVKYIAPFVHLVHAVDSEKLLKMLQKEALKNQRTITCMLQAKIAQEESKFGLTFEEIETLLAKKANYPNIHITGLMGMATNTLDKDEVRKEFQTLNDFFKKHQSKQFNTLSIGMSNDWTLAIEEGSTMIRVGSSIFGPRNY